MLFWTINAMILVIIILLLLLISMTWPPDSPWAPFWTTKPAIARLMCTMANINEKTIVYELGCGTATILTVAAKEFHSPGVGIEIDPLRFVNAWININVRYKVGDRVTLIRDNFFNIPLSQADVLFIYLIPNALKRLTSKFLKEVKPGALFVSYVYPFPTELFKGRLRLVKHDTKNRIYMYKMLASRAKK